MSDVKYKTPITLSALMVVGVSVISITSILSFSSIQAQPAQTLSSDSNHLILPAGTQIPVRYNQGSKILLTREETLALTLQVASNITNAEGKIVIPDGSEIIGQIQPTSKGSKFFSHTILIKTENQTNLETSLDAISQVINNIETLVKGVNPDEILKGATVSQQAEKLITSFREYSRRGRNRIDSSELEALAGWFLGSETLELLSINPEKDLGLTLRSELVLK